MTSGKISFEHLEALSVVGEFNSPSTIRTDPKNAFSFFFAS